MRYVALATDYDGTLARDGRVSDDVLDALARVRKSGRRLILVSGRELEDLESVFSRLDLFHLAVLENGALLYDPATRKEIPLGDPPPPDLIAGLRAAGAPRMSVGRVIIATWEPFEKEAIEVIRHCGLEHQMIFNKGAIMILPPGVNKASGLKKALRHLGLSPHNVVGVGDAENDHAFLRLCECSAAVRNALPAVQAEVDLVTRGDHGQGVRELCERLLEDDLHSIEPRLDAAHLLIGHGGDGSPVRLAYGTNVLVVGSSGAGKSTFVTSLVERLLEQEYQFCVVDPEGDYEGLGEPDPDRAENVVVVGGPKTSPRLDEVEQVLGDTLQSVVVNLLAVSLEDRPAFLLELLSRLEKLRGESGRPHWVIMDEAHHLLPSGSRAVRLPFTGNIVMITLRPATVRKQALSCVDRVVLIGAAPSTRLQDFVNVLGIEGVPRFDVPDLEPGHAVIWNRREPQAAPRGFRLMEPTIKRRRHKRKYAQGELPEGEGFYFRGPHRRLNLLANNLTEFLRMADGVDDETWTFHLARGDYARWFRDNIKDDDLARHADEVAREKLSPEEGRKRIREAVERIYTLQA
jgi:hydroxymethylpyrimidine pyrophosphatase-like HAD family hydrolase